METTKYKKVAKSVATNAGFTIDQLKEKDRSGYKVATRQVVYYLLLTNKICSTACAGSIFDQDHATAIHGKNTVELLLQTKYPQLLYEYVTDLINKANAVENSYLPKVQGGRNLRGFSAQQPPWQRIRNRNLPAMRRRPGYAGANGNPPYPISRMRLQQQGITQ